MESKIKEIFIVEALQKTLEDYENFSQQLMKIFISIEQPKEKIKSVQNFEKEKPNLKFLCQKFIKLGEVSFECFTCAEEPDSHLLCSDCFSNHYLSHIGHKVESHTNKVGFCDCGDKEMIKYEGFCDKHKKRKKSMEDLEIGEIIYEKNIDNITFSNLKINSCENIEHDEIRKNEKKKGEIEIFFETMFYSIIQFCEFLETEESLKIDYLIKYQKLSFYIFLFVNSLLDKKENLEKLSEIIICPFSRLSELILRHDCQYEGEFKLANKNVECQCSIIENLIRYHSKYGKEAKVVLTEIIFKLMQVKQVQMFFGNVYTKSFNLFVIFPNDENNIEISGFFSFYTQFCTQNLNVVLFQENFIKKVLIMIEKIIIFFDKYPNIAFNQYDILNKFTDFFTFLSKRKNFETLFKFQSALEILIKIIVRKTKRIFRKEIPFKEDAEKFQLYCETFLLNLFQKILAKLKLLKDLEQKYIFNLLFNYCGKSLTKLADLEILNNKNKSLYWPLCFPAIRCYYILICFGFTIYEFKYIDNIVSKHLEKNPKTFSVILSLLMNALKYSYENDKKINFYELFENHSETVRYEILNKYYNKSFYLLYDYDLSFSQFLIGISNEFNFDEFLSIFGIEKDKSFNQVILHFLVQLSLYEIPFVNCMSFLKFFSIDNKNENTSRNLLSLSTYRKDHTALNKFYWMKNSLKYFLANSFYCLKIKSFENIQNLHFFRFLNYEIAIQPFIETMAHKLNNSSALKLDEEYSKFFEPFMFAKYKKIDKMFIENWKEENNYQKIETVVGNKMYNITIENNFLIWKERTSLFSSSLPLYLKNNFADINNDVIKTSHFLKLIYINFETACEILSSEIEEYYNFDEKDKKINAVVIKNLNNIYLKSDFKTTLKNFKEIPKFKEFVLTVEKIEKILNDCNELLTIIETPVNSIQNFEESPKKINLFKSKQQLIKEEFMKKQQNFLNKNKNAFEMIKQPIENEEICYHCKSLLISKENQLCGTFAYICVENLNAELSVQERYMINSCMHYLHKDCFDKIFKNNPKQIFNKKILAKNYCEMICFHCKALSNIFFYFVEHFFQQKSFESLKPNLKMISNPKIEIDINSVCTQANDKEKIGKILDEFLQSFVKNLNIEKSIIRKFCQPNNFILFTKENMAPACMNILLNAMNIIGFSGLKTFLDKFQKIYRNFYLIFRESIISSDTFLLTIKSDVQKYFCNTIKINFDITIMWENAWNVAILTDNNKEYQLTSFLTIIHSFFNLVFLLHFKNNNYKIELQKMKEEYPEIQRKSIIYLEQAVGFLTIVFPMQENTIQKIKENNSIDFLLKMLSLEDFQVESNILEKCTFNTSAYFDIYAYIYQLKCVDSLRQFNTFQNYIKLFFKENCIKCGEFSKIGNLHACLICGEMLCSIACKSADNSYYNFNSISKMLSFSHSFPKTYQSQLNLSYFPGQNEYPFFQNRIGNLNKHALENHFGKSVFINCKTGMIIIISFPRTIISGFLFKDTLNQIPNIYNKLNNDYENFALDLDEVKKIKDILLLHKTPQEIVHKIIQNPNCFIKNYYL